MINRSKHVQTDGQSRDQNSTR